MKKTSKILSGSLLVALMSIGLVTKVDVKHDDHHLEVRDVLAEDVTKDVTGKVVRRADGEAPEAANNVAPVKAQVSAEAEGKRSIRFVAGIDSYDYHEVMFNVTMALDDEEDKVWSHTVSTAYEKVVADGVELTAAEAFGDGYNYLVAFTINNVPSAYWDKAFEVKTSVKQAVESAAVESDAVTKVVADLVALDKEEVTPTPVPSDTKLEPKSIYAYAPNYIEVRLPKTDVLNSASLVNRGSVKGNIVSSCTNVFDFGADQIALQINTTIVVQNSVFNMDFEFEDTNGNKYTVSFSVSNGQILTLDGYKTNASSELNRYPASQGYVVAKYTAENWSLLNGYIEEGRTNINAANSFEEVDAALAAAKALIDAVPQQVVVYHTVSFYNGDEFVSSKDVIEGTAIGEMPTIPGREVEGYYTTPTFEDGTEVTAETVVAGGPMNVYLKLVEIAADVVTVTPYEIYCYSNTYIGIRFKFTDTLTSASKIERSSFTGPYVNYSNNIFNFGADAIEVQILCTINTEGQTFNFSCEFKDIAGNKYRMAFAVSNGKLA